MEPAIWCMMSIFYDTKRLYRIQFYDFTDDGILWKKNDKEI